MRQWTTSTPSTVLTAVVASALALLSTVSTACHEPDHVVLCEVGEVSAGVELSLDAIRLPKGTAVAFKVIPIRDDGKYMDDETSVSVSCDHDTVLGVNPVTPGVDSACAGPKDAPWIYVLYGKTTGQTEVHLSVEGHALHTIPVEVY